jgi:hypothetical protein
MTSASLPHWERGGARDDLMIGPSISAEREAGAAALAILISE